MRREVRPMECGRVRKDKRRGKSAAAEKWLKRQLEFRDEQRIPEAVGGRQRPRVAGRVGRRTPARAPFGLSFAEGDIAFVKKEKRV